MRPKNTRKYRKKKERGWRNKQFFAIQISQITKDGFWLHNNEHSFYVSRKRYPWFLDATNNEIMNVRKVRDLTGDDHGDMFVWDSLDIELPIHNFIRQEIIQIHSVYVRGIHREDLYAQYLQGVETPFMEK